MRFLPRRRAQSGRECESAWIENRSRDMSQIWHIAVTRAIAILRIGNMLSSGYNADHEEQIDSILMSYKIRLVDATGQLSSNVKDGNL